ncbi:MFS transporter [Ktedonobacteria bacterium brp13]|nr:MFS transporter [Ktedonobacteria bacterium brp13]
MESSRSKNAHRWPHLRWVILATDCLILALNYGDRSAISIAAPFIMKDFHFTEAQFGIILSIFFVGYVPFCFIGGWTSDKFGPRKIMTWATLVWSIFVAATVVGFNFVSFLIIRALFGFGEGPQGAVMTKTMSNWFPQRELGTSVGIAQAATPLGGAIATPIIVALLVGSHDNWRIPFIIMGAVGILFAIGWFVIIRDKPEQHPWITAQELKKIREGALARRPEYLEDGSTPRMITYLKMPLVWSTAWAFFGYAWVLYTFLSWFPEYLLQKQHISLSSLAVAGAIPWLAGAVACALGGIATDWIGKKTGHPAVARKWMIVVCLLLVALLFTPIGMITSAVVAVALMALIVFLLYLTTAQYFAIIGDVVPSSRLGGVMGLVHLIANLAGVIAPVVTGFLISGSNNWTAAFGIAAAICLTGSLSMAFFARIDRTRKLTAGIPAGQVDRVGVVSDNER